MTALGTGFSTVNEPLGYNEPIRVVLGDGSSEAVAEFCTQALQVLQQLSSVATSLGGAAGALAAAAGEVANNARGQSQRDVQIIQSLGAVTRMLDECSQTMASMSDMPAPEITVEANAAPPAVTVLPAQPSKKTLTITSRDADGRMKTATVQEQ